MSRLFPILVLILLLPVLIPLAIYIGIRYHWTDTVPEEEDV